MRVDRVGGTGVGDVLAVVFVRLLPLVGVVLTRDRR